MKYEEINKRFTQKVAEWLVKGYVINTSTMGGSQGEIGKVDLTNGDEIIRVFAQSFREFDEEKEFCYYEGVEIVVGKVTDEVKPNSEKDYWVVWNSHLEVVSTERFYLIGENRNYKWYGTKEEAEYQQGMKSWRRQNKRGCNKYRKEFSDESKKVVVGFVKRQPRCKSVKATDITEVIHVVEINRFGKLENTYEVKVKGNWYRLK